MAASRIPESIGFTVNGHEHGHPPAAKASTELPEWLKNLAEQAQPVHRVLQQFSHPISAADISRQFAEGKKAANVAREQQIGHILETIFTLGLLRKTGEGGYVR